MFVHTPLLGVMCFCAWWYTAQVHRQNNIDVIIWRLNCLSIFHEVCVSKWLHERKIEHVFFCIVRTVQRSQLIEKINRHKRPNVNLFGFFCLVFLFVLLSMPGTHNSHSSVKQQYIQCVGALALQSATGSTHSIVVSMTFPSSLSWACCLFATP